MKKILGLRTTIYRVPDLAAAKAWYNKAFQTEPYFDEPFYVGYNIAGYELGLMPFGEDSVSVGTNILSYWGVADVQEAYDFFLAAGAVSDGPPTNVGGEIMTAEVKDPWGNLIGLIYNPEFSL